MLSDIHERGSSAVPASSSSTRQQPKKQQGRSLFAQQFDAGSIDKTSVMRQALGQRRTESEGRPKPARPFAFKQAQAQATPASAAFGETPQMRESIHAANMQKISGEHMQVSHRARTDTSQK